MNVKRLFIALMLMILALGTNVMMAQQMPPIPVDDQVRIGKLDCGLTYYIRHNNYPEHRVNFYIAQRVGGLHPGGGEPARSGPLPGAHGLQRQ